MPRQVDRNDLPSAGRELRQQFVPPRLGRSREAVEEHERLRTLPSSPCARTFQGMRILVIGATGTIGSAVADALRERGHDIVGAGATSGERRVDISDPASIERLYESAGPLDAVVCAAGVARFGPLDALTAEDFDLSVRSKLLGQVELVRRGVGVVGEGGSFTLTSGDLSTAPEPGTVAVVMTGAAVEAFARAAALDLDGRYRVNVVSPGAVAESLEAAGRDASGAVRVRDVAAHYVRSVEGHETGTVFDARAFERRGD